MWLKWDLFVRRLPPDQTNVSKQRFAESNFRKWHSITFLLNSCVLSLLCFKLHRLAYFLYMVISRVASPQGTWIRDFTDRIKKKKSPEPGRIQTHDLKSLAPQACTLPLCFNRCPLINQLKIWQILSVLTFVNSDGGRLAPDLFEEDVADVEDAGNQLENLALEKNWTTLKTLSIARWFM